MLINCLNSEHTDQLIKQFEAFYFESRFQVLLQNYRVISVEEVTTLFHKADDFAPTIFLKIIGPPFFFKLSFSVFIFTLHLKIKRN
jgi:hypothetical protein